MKIRTVKYIIKEGILNVYKNKLMTLASISTVLASLILFGIFILIAVNLDYNTSTLEQLPQIQVYLNYELDDAQINQIETDIRENEGIAQIDIVTKKEAFEKVKEIFAEDSATLEGYDESFLPVSFKIKLKNPENSTEIKEELENIEGVDSVESPQKTIDIISNIGHWLKIISGFLILLLVVIAVFIISNTIKLAVFARRKEIGIMKYIGSTDWFIRWPFIVEGVIIGIVGAIIAFLLTSYGYKTLEVRFNSELLRSSFGFIRLVRHSQINFVILVFYLFLGGIVGSVGSLLSLRKYLKV